MCTSIQLDKETCSNIFTITKDGNNSFFFYLTVQIADNGYAQTDASDVTRLANVLQLEKQNQEAAALISTLVESCLQNPLTKWEGNLTPSSMTGALVKKTFAPGGPAVVAINTAMMDTVSTVMTKTWKM